MTAIRIIHERNRATNIGFELQSAIAELSKERESLHQLRIQRAATGPQAPPSKSSRNWVATSITRRSRSHERGGSSSAVIYFEEKSR